MKKKYVTIVLFTITILLMILAVYLGYLMKDTNSSATKITKTKAQSVTYKKLLALNLPTNPAQAPEQVTPTEEISPTGINSSPTPTIELTETPIPTEIILAREDSSSTGSSTMDEGIPTVSPTGIENLPESGWIQSSLIIFAFAGTIILFSLLY